MTYVLIEWFLMGCDAQMRIVGVSANQQYAYNWVQANESEFTRREAREVQLFV